MNHIAAAVAKIEAATKCHPDAVPQFINEALVLVLSADTTRLKPGRLARWTTAASKLASAKACHPNARLHLLNEAWELLNETAPNHITYAFNELLGVGIPINSEPMLQVGQRARKIGGNFQADGRIEAAWVSPDDGKPRYVFRFDVPAGMLHIYTGAQLEALP